MLQMMDMNYFKVHYRHLKERRKQEENMITVAMTMMIIIIKVEEEENVKTIEMIIEGDGVVDTVVIQPEEEKKMKKIIPSHFFKVELY